uniref:Uncharacterized protein n=1 Tax=Meloidogyne incognita TaxID=6306 RepID=A0A914KK38_MELIC
MQVSNNINRFKHVTLLIIAEVICEKCIIASFGIENIGQRAEGCFCGKPCNDNGGAGVHHLSELFRV